METIYFAILIGALLLLISIFSSLLSFRIGAPLLLVFLGVGLAAGEDGIGGLIFNDAPLAFFIGSLALAVILFDSGFTTPIGNWRLTAAPAATLATLGTAITAVGITPVAYAVLDVTWAEALLLGAIISSTDAAAVFFLLRTGGITLRDRVRSTLEIESGSNDPMAILLTIGIVEFITTGPDLPGLAMAELFLSQILGGIALGLLGGLVIIAVVNRVKLDTGLYPIVVMSLAVLVFGATNVIGGSGFLAVYLAGLIAGNARLKGSLALKRFQSGLTWLSQIVMFLTLGLLATPSQFPALILPALAIAAMLVFLARPLAVIMCLLPFRFTSAPYGDRETAFIGWVGLRGAVSILLALVPILAGLEIGQTLFNIAFLIVVASLVVQGWTIRPVARWLNLLVPRRTARIDKVELELPGLTDCELVTYHIHGTSPVARGIRIPRWARPALIRRGGATYNIHTIRQIQEADQVYLFASPAQLPLLDRLYGATAKPEEDDEVLLGEFVINISTNLGSLADSYGLPVDENLRGLSVAECFARHYPDIEIGDRIDLGGIALVARDVEDGALLAAGLAVDPPSRPTAPAPLRRVAEWLGGRDR